MLHEQFDFYKNWQMVKEYTKYKMKKITSKFFSIKKNLYIT
jgi:hypothetical protein